MKPLHTCAGELNRSTLQTRPWSTSRRSTPRRFCDLSVSYPRPQRAPYRRQSLIPNGDEKPRLTTRHGHDLDVAVSALQKAIRRSHVDDAAYWSMELFDRYPAYLWRRLKIILSEDIGIADPTLPAVIDALHSTYTEQRQEEAKRGGNGGRLPTLHAVVLMASAKKSRMVNHALIHHTAGDLEELYRDPPDWALDRHTKRGRQMGRDMEHFFEEAALLADPETGALSHEGNLWDPYLDRARKALGQ
jgi:hypothetical protein